jgi:hypothetical protein
LWQLLRSGATKIKSGEQDKTDVGKRERKLSIPMMPRKLQGEYMRNSILVKGAKGKQSEKYRY